MFTRIEVHLQGVDFNGHLHVKEILSVSSM